MLLEASALIAAVAFAVLTAYIVSTLIQVRKTTMELERLLGQVNAELPLLLRELRQTTEKVNLLAEQARDGVEHAAVFLHAVGDIGQTVQQMHGLVRGQGEHVLGRLGLLMTGLRAATAVIKERLSKSSGEPNGAR
ncbi:DUF948 domain-containing protein [Candidatus Nitrospira bockiana]